MLEFHPMEAFFQQVNKVELMGKDKPLIPEGITESTRVGIGIAIGLVIISLIAGISLLVVRIPVCQLLTSEITEQLSKCALVTS